MIVDMQALQRQAGLWVVIALVTLFSGRYLYADCMIVQVVKPPLTLLNDHHSYTSQLSLGLISIDAWHVLYSFVLACLFFSSLLCFFFLFKNL